MALRKCPNCKDTVGADSEECPRCGVSFRAVMLRRLLLWGIVLGLVGLAIVHYALKLI